MEPGTNQLAPNGTRLNLTQRKRKSRPMPAALLKCSTDNPVCVPKLLLEGWPPCRPLFFPQADIVGADGASPSSSQRGGHHPKISISSRLSRHSQRGVALVIVLGFLVLITVVIVAFLSSVSTEYSTASSASAGASSRELADASVQLVMGQIRQATSLGANVAWASQPGMIRTYGSGSAGTYSAASAPLAYYKLYSSDNMVVDSSATSGYDPGADVPTTWSSRPALFTDLNSPITSAAGTVNYPIIDPTAADVPTGKSDPMVEGFSINQTSSSPAYTTNSPNNSAPMPTKWIYVLRDGTLTAPIDADSTAAYAEMKNAAAGKIPSTDNPIVGRIAFWTDDETCKLNLNTACGGTYWEDPMFSSDMDLAFSRYKPMANEFNRYPGHPATTSLLPVFWSLDGMASPYENFFPSLAASTHYMGIDLAPTFSANATLAFQNILQLSPRNAWGGSQMGTAPTAGHGSGNATLNPPPVVPDSDRLYASVDEAIFGYADRSTGAASANVLSMTKDKLKKLRFFLTTSSRSPETNPFNQPKVGIWPVPEILTKRTPADKLIAFCSTLKADATQTPSATSNFTYFFTRNNAQSATADWTTRNSQVFSFLDTAFQNPIPGFGASIDSRYTVDGGRRILTLIYDYIRSTFNLLDTNLGSTPKGGDVRYLLFNNTFMGAANDPQGFGYGQVVPIQITKSGTTFKGIGRFPLIKQVAVMFMVRAANQPPVVCNPNGRPVVYDASHAVISDSSGNILPAYYSTVFSGAAVAKLNPQHPWVAGNMTDSNLATTYVPQFMSGTAPVMAIDTALFAADPNNAAAFLPTFGIGVVDKISGSSVASITNNSTVPASSGYTQYPSIYGTAAANGYYGITAGTTGNITISGTPYTYAKAAFPPPPATPLNLPQTHAGMPYLTVQSANSTTGLAGAFVVPNPRYQGKNTNAAYELPDPVNLPPGSTEMQAAFLMDPVNVSPGITPMIPKYQVTVTGLSAFKAGGTALGFSSPATQSNQFVSQTTTSYHNLGMESISIGVGTYQATRISSASNQSKLSWLSAPVIVSDTSFSVTPSFSFTGGTITIDMYATPIAGGNVVPVVTSGASASTLVQTYNIKFPDDTFPTPLLPQMPSMTAGAQTSNTLLYGLSSTAPQPPGSPFPALPHIFYNANNDAGYYSNSSYRIPSDPANVPSRIADLVPSSLLTSDAGCSLSKKPNVGVGTSFICPVTTTTTFPGGIPTAGTVYTQTACYNSDYVNTIPGCGYTANTSGQSRFCYGAGNDTAMLAYFLPQRNGYAPADVRVKLTCDTIRAVECLYGDPRIFASLPVVGTQFFAPHRFYSDLTMRAAHTFRGAIFGAYPDACRNASSNWRGATDHYLSDAYVSDASWNYNPWATGTPGAYYITANTIGRNQGDKFAQLGGSSAGGGQNGMLRSQAPYTTSSSEFNDTTFNATTPWNGLTKFSDVWKTGGDFSNGGGSEPDGPYINKPSEAGGMTNEAGSVVNYYPEWWNYTGTVGFSLSSQFSPNRLISSPVAFGSLPTPSPLNLSPGTPSPVDAWHTLLFCANPNASTPAAYGTRMSGTDVTLANQPITAAKCPDHLILDFFAMPVVEPYAISEPFSTAGKVNMNYQIAPFTYITRNTALRGVFRGTMLTAVDDQFVPSKTGNEDSYYKSNIMNTSMSAITFATAAATDTYGQFLTASGNWGFRYPIHAGETLKQFQARFDNNHDLFRSPSEICSLFLYPAKQPTAALPTNPATSLVTYDAANANILDWWYKNPATTRKSLTGDNLRERPYGSLYPRLTTKSNSYTVHFRVQVLKKIPGTSATQWVEGKDVVASEFRGSSLIERYIDPSDPSLPDFAIDPTKTLDSYYKFRVVSTKKFTVE